MSELLKTLRSILDKREKLSARRRLSLVRDDAIDFSSNDFLSLSKSASLRSAYLKEFNQSSSVPLGSGGSRLLDGNSAYAENLEKDIAAFHGAPSGLLFNSGFDANSGLFSCIAQDNDIFVHDEYIHASVHEGMRLSRAKTCISFVHNSVDGLNRVLSDLTSKHPGLKQGHGNVFIAVESVYSMDGDVAPMKSILDAIDMALPHHNGHLIVDEAHSTGIYGVHGRGIICELGVEDRVLVRLHTFGKSLSSGGAILLCPPILREYLINYARSLIYTTALSLPTLAMIKAVYGQMCSGDTHVAQTRLWELISYLHTQLLRLPSSPYLNIPHEPPKSPIFSLCTPHPRLLAGHCQQEGFVVRPIVPPTVPEGSQRIRVCLHAGNTEREIDSLVVALRDWLSRVDIASDGRNLEASQRSRL